MISRTRVGRSLWLGLAGAAVLLTACSPTFEEVAAEHRPAVESVFGKIQALATTVQNTPPIIEDTMDIAGARIALDGETSNALYVRAEHLAMPTNANSDGNGGTYAFTIATCGEALRGDFHGAPEGMAHFLAECGRAEYLFVQRTHTERLPQVLDRQSFEPGAYEGEILLFRLADGALLGGFRVSAANSDEVTVTTDASGNALDVVDRLESDLNAEVFVAIKEKLQMHVPGVISD